MLSPQTLDEFSNKILPSIHALEADMISMMSATIAEAILIDDLAEEYFLLMNALEDKFYEIRQRHDSIIKRNLAEIITRASTQSMEDEAIPWQSRAYVAGIISSTQQAMSSKIQRSIANLEFGHMPINQAVQNTVATIKNDIPTIAETTVDASLFEMQDIIAGHLGDLFSGGMGITGERNTFDATLRMELLQACKHSSMEVSDVVAKIIGGFDGYQISAHKGARPSHQEWQGIIVSRYRGISGYEWYGERVQSGLIEKNCRHSKEPIRLGTPNRYTQEQLRAMNANVEFEGRTMESWQANNKMREMERRSRKITRELYALEGAELSDSVRHIELSNQQRNLYSLYSRFASATGFPKQNDRFWMKDIAFQIAHDVANKRKLGIISSSALDIASKRYKAQFGKKFGEHAHEFGLNPKSASDRAKMQNIINDTIDNFDEIRRGTFLGQSGAVDFYIKENVVVIVNSGKLVTAFPSTLGTESIRTARRIM